jgi:hypothetical protein
LLDSLVEHPAGPISFDRTSAITVKANVEDAG